MEIAERMVIPKCYENLRQPLWVTPFNKSLVYKLLFFTGSILQGESPNLFKVLSTHLRILTNAELLTNHERFFFLFRNYSVRLFVSIMCCVYHMLSSRFFVLAFLSTHKRVRLCKQIYYFTGHTHKT